MAEYGGWAGRLLFVDLTAGQITERSTFDYVPEYIGGRGMGIALAWELLRPGVGPLDPENPLMFLTGPFSGTLAPSSGRTTICALSPQGYPTPWFSRASMGGDLGHHLKYAGYDGVVFVGQAPEPVCLWVHDDGAELIDAQELWGLGIMETQRQLQRRFGSKVQVATIGPAGENQSCIASIGTNEGSAAGQGGFGAVMGSKNLKAVAVLGTGRPTIHDQNGFRELNRAIAREMIDDGKKRGARGPATPGKYKVKPLHCSTGCITGCGRHYEDVPGTLFPDQTYNGVVQCTSGRFAGGEGRLWNLGFEAGFELNMLANDWGINHWDLMKGLFPWISMCYNAGMLPTINGRPVELQDPRFWYEVLVSIATQQGPMAEIVGHGGRRAIARTGLLPEEAIQLYTGWGYANHWDGRGPAGNDIRYPFWLVAALIWMVDNRDPMGSTHGYVQDMMRVSPFNTGVLSWETLQGIGQRVYGRPEAMDPLSNYEGKAEPALWHLQASLIKDSLPLCDRVFPRLFTSLSEDGLPRVQDGDRVLEGPDFEARMLSLATGYEVTSEELHQSAERILTQERLMQIRDFGRTRAMDDDVVRYFCETAEERANPLLGECKSAELEPLRALADEFYALRGWDPATGDPTSERLAQLGLAAKRLEVLGG